MTCLTVISPNSFFLPVLAFFFVGIIPSSNNSQVKRVSVDLVCLVDLVHLIRSIQPNRPNEQGRLTPITTVAFSSLLQNAAPSIDVGLPFLFATPWDRAD